MIVGWLALTAAAHPGASEMHPEGCDVEAWLAQARALTADGRHDSALVAIDHAAACGAEAPRIALARGLASTGPEAVVALRTAVELLPEHAGARIALARALAAEGHTAEALEHARIGLAHVEHPHPDDVLLAASLSSDPAAALLVLDDGIARSGPSPALVEAAARTELALGYLDAALGRFPSDTLRDQAQRARLLAEAGDTERARQAYDEALRTADGAPRRTSALLALRRALASERGAL